MRERTVVVLGAGASKVFGLPLGAELRDNIARDLNIKFDRFGRDLTSGSYEITDALRLIFRQDGRQESINPYRLAAVEIAEAMPFSSSIDEYIERHSDDMRKALCAKLAIGKSILEAERKSTLYWDARRLGGEDGLPLEAAQTWLSYFLRDLTRGKTRSDIATAFKKITVVNFNYDRCFEQFAYVWLQSVYRLDREDAAEIVKSIGVYHPYGRLSELSWEDSSGIRYGAEMDVRKLLKMADRIRTYSEAKEPETGIDLIKERISKSSSIVFLGFGFHQQNIELLTVDGRKNAAMKCYATTSGLSEPSWNIFKNRVKTMLAISPERNLNSFSLNGTCEKFWAEYSTPILA